MECKIVRKQAFSVIGRLGSTSDGEGFIGRLWEQANAGFPQVEPLAKRTQDGGFAGFWGLMSDEGMNFRPWEENFSKGLYLAGVEVEDSAQPPEGWVKWTSPGQEYLVAEPGPESFARALEYIKNQSWELAGAVYDFTDPGTGKSWQYFPIKK